jgi:Transposase, Mutator family
MWQRRGSRPSSRPSSGPRRSWIYGASVSKETISRITDKIVEEMNDWSVRPLDAIYAAVFIDAIVVKIRDGQVANRPVYAAIGVTLDGERDILGLWAGSGGEGAKFRMSVLTDLRNRGVKDVFFVVCDGLKGLPDVVTNVWPQTIVQTCIIHLIRNTFRLTSRKYWDELKRDVKPIYTAVNADAARAAFEDAGPGPGHSSRARCADRRVPGQDRHRIWHGSGTRCQVGMMAINGLMREKNPRPARRSWVEPRGLEPLTPTLPVWCATSCATAPSAQSGWAPAQ